ncbi:hypothetical protein NBRC10512_000823 [Rhodotorula toruloides]|uniref:RHTO0S06e08064g1_1 n=2 Tax=Rhodotorula toruloides TaxID=5286 RepID=A0A061AWK8_RHOTO|nr:uncharacterized protein RHTO_06345 [Rhodotorula toruloides NP11]EMS24340.1 hypothetical protein RHTO_06345 [Rhodotorula toruloides NP11]CDR41943.1 RHTO0S06e08064g1_1 [Rhodotorula toruloides]
MAPLKLPKKGKQKQTHIDFSSIDTARASAPQDWGPDDWLQEGDRQDENGTRYQSGSKAARHFTNSTVCYRLAASLSPADFDARYNAARAYQTLATDHLPPPECATALETARDGYREALGVLVEGEEGTATARIDALFNLAQADVALFEMLEEGVVSEPDEDERKAHLAKEARDLFVEVERSQRVEMERFFGQGGPVGAEDDAAADETASVASGAETSVQAIQTTIVTPQLVIDTLLESIAFDISLHDSSLSSDPDTQAQLRQSAIDSFARATTLRSTIPSENPELDFELAHTQATLLTTFSPAEATPFLSHLLASSPSARIELLSLYADHLLDSLSPSDSLSNALSTLQTALRTYERASSLLSNRLSPPKQIPASHLPSLLASNLASRAQVHLLAFHLIKRAHEVDPTSAKAEVPFAQGEEHLRLAHSLALESSAAPKSGLALVISSSATAAGGPSTKPPLAIGRSPPSIEPRTDWRTLSALRTALFTLVRIRLRMDPSPEGLTNERSRFWALWRALGLARGGESEGEVRRREVRWWIEEMEGDKVGEVVGEEEARGEREWWEGLLA